jgi:hypothetical protein
MLLWLADYLAQYYKGFHVFNYLTLRAMLSILTALAIALWFGPWMIERCVRLNMVKLCVPMAHKRIWLNQVHPRWVGSYFSGDWCQYLVVGKLE